MEPLLMPKTLNVRLPEGEIAILTRYATATRRNKTDVVREFVRSLAAKTPKTAQAKA
jgi:hypothetical protein